MSVLIKGMEMPKNCKKCGFRHLRWEYVRCPYEGEIDVSQSEDCPLVEVPTPHGKLADCDAIEECLHGVIDCDDKIYALGLLSWAANKRTVIEAEVET